MRRSVAIARLRLATFVPGAAALVWAMAGGGSRPAIAGLLMLLAFAVLVVWHARVDARAAWFDALHVVNRQALARINRDWDALPLPDPPLPAPPAAGSDAAGAPDRPTRSSHVDGLASHPYANDLDLFGRASLLQWLGPPSTAQGTQTLQAWLLHPAAPEEIDSRHGAVAALAPLVDWREQLGAHGRLAADVRAPELGEFLRWARSDGPFSVRQLGALHAAVLGLTGAIWGLIALQAVGAVDAAYWLIPLTAGIVLSFVTGRQVSTAFDRAGAGQHAFARYAELFAHAAAVPAEAPRLTAIRGRLSASGMDAPRCMRRLNRIIGFAQLRAGAGILHFPIQALTLWDLHVFFALERWRRRVGPAVPDWMAALGELDALSTFGRIRFDNPSWCLPEFVREPLVLAARNLGHPLIADDRRVGNDVEVGPPGTLLLITGSNMSGKSTLLRAIGLNTVLAQAGAPVCAASMRLPPVDLETSIRVQDSLEEGLSYFMAALARLKAVVDRARRPPAGAATVLYLLDEILQGTNTAERAVAVRGIARHLLAAGAIGVMTTHDLGLAGEEPLHSSARLDHFTESVDRHGVMSFDYRLRPGLATSRNALRLMRLIGLDLEVPPRGPEDPPRGA